VEEAWNTVAHKDILGLIGSIPYRCKISDCSCYMNFNVKTAESV